MSCTTLVSHPRYLGATVSLSTVLLLCLLPSLPSPPLLLLPQQTDSPEYSPGTTGEQVQASRRVRVRDVCQDYRGHGVLTPMNPYYASKFYPASLTLGDREGLAWCRVGKAATTAWAALFLLLREVPLPQVRAAVANLTAHELLKATFPSKPSERLHMVRGEHGTQYFTFLVVRHPFVRLVSAYRDKLETLTEYNVRYHIKDAPRMTERRVHNSSVADSPTFPEFVDYLLRTPPNLMDKHWAPYSKLCLPCNLTYSAILKLETLKEDADWMFPHLGLDALRPAWDSVSGTNAGVHVGPGGAGGQDSAQRSAAYYSLLHRETIARLYTKYKVDFAMFGYDSQVQRFLDMGL